MDDWQKAHIRENYPALLELTSCNKDLFAVLEAEGLLHEDEVDCIKSRTTEKEKSSKLFEILTTKTKGYFGVIKALKACKQTGALQLLLELPTKHIGNIRVNFLDGTRKVSEILTTDQVTAVRKWIMETIVGEDSSQQIFEEVYNSNVIIQLIRNTVPVESSLYIDRFLSQRRILVNPELFDENCSDVYVFKNIQKFKLREFITSYVIDYSSVQLLHRRPTVRFILLQNHSDWEHLLLKVDKPLHLLRYEEENKVFWLEATSGEFEKLQAFIKSGENENPNYISEDEFIHKTKQVKNVCICDLPGMEKTMLLASIARKFRNTYKDKLVSFIQLRDLIYRELSTEELRFEIIRYISTSTFAGYILDFIFKNQSIKFELFLDGLDEVHDKHLDTVLFHLQNITKSMPNARLFVSCRPVVRQQLEKAIGALSYDIKPFDKTTQVEFLQKTWTHISGSENAAAFCEYASLCLENLENNLTSKDQDIAGILLLCKLIAQVHFDYAAAYCNNSSLTPSSFTHSLLEICRMFMARQLGSTKCNFECMSQLHSRSDLCDVACNVKSIHVWQAIKLIFPDLADKLADQVSKFKNISPHQIFFPGILEGAKQFVHRTLAEYLVAEFFADVLYTCSNQAKTGWIEETHGKQTLEQWIFDELFPCRHCNYYKTLPENVVAYFLNALILERGCTSHYFVNTSVSPATQAFKCALISCLRSGFEALAQILLDIAIKEQSGTERDFYFYDEVYRILNKAVRNCSLQTIEKLHHFYLKCYSFNFLFELPLEKYDKYVYVLKKALQKADFEIAKFLVKSVPLHNLGVIYACLEDTLFESEKMVEKRIEVAQLLVSRCPSLVFESRFNLPGPLFAECLHFSAIQWLVENRADIWLKDDYDRTFLDKATSYEPMSKEKVLELCQLVFEGRTPKDLLRIFQDSKLEFDFYFCRTTAIKETEYLVRENFEALTREQICCIWQAALLYETEV